MAHRYKPLDQQTVVVTGASSGIGLATARQAARKGEQVVLASRSEEALREICDEINASGPGRAVCVVADVGNKAQVKHIVDVAVEAEATAMTGLAPVPHDSGAMRGRRAIAGGRRALRHVLFQQHSPLHVTTRY